MFNKFINGTLNAKMHWQLFRTLMLVSNTASLFIYGFLHFIFFDFPFEVNNELITLLKLFSVASSFAAGISLLILISDFIEFAVRSKKQLLIPVYVKTFSVALIAIILLLNSCNTPVTAGIKKDFNTGLSSAYTGMEPEKVFLVMNNETLNHADIPLGESFLLVNDNIKGLQPKNGKVTVGCSLKISDQMGKVLLNEKDLFAGHDQFEEKDAKMLKCTVNTGEPMQWEEKYNVAVTFWDKNGSGKIENNVTIRCIDIP
jgi:hypothetical protein